MSILPNLGDGRLAVPKVYLDGVIYHTAETTLVDLDGDGALDLADLMSTTPVMKLSIRYNDGHGFLGPARLLDAVPTAEALAAIDVDDDGIDDLITANQVGNVSVFTNRRDAGFLPIQTSQTGLAGRTVDSADFNGDGRPDVAALDGNISGFAVFLGQGDGRLGPARRYANTLGVRALGSGDFNGDGAADLVAAVTDGTLRVSMNDRDGGFVAAAPISISGYPNSLAAADLNGDGRADLVVAQAGGLGTFPAVTLLYSDALGVLSRSASFPVIYPPSGVAVGDLSPPAQGLRARRVPPHLDHRPEVGSESCKGRAECAAPCSSSPRCFCPARFRIRRRAPCGSWSTSSRA